MNWITEHWEIIALVVSEVLAFIPVKANGIADSVFRILTAIFKKK